MCGFVFMSVAKRAADIVQLLLFFQVPAPTW